jgi:PRC-barrel domain
MSSGDPVSWFVIEAGWKVVDTNGEEVGSVDEVVGDSGDDIFNGLSVSTGLLSRPVYVPSEQVGQITQGRVQLRLTRDQVRHLAEYEEPPTSAEIEPEGAGTWRRTEAAVEAPIHSHEERLNLLTRIVHAVRRGLRR